MATHTLSHGTLVIGEGNIRFFPNKENVTDAPRQGSLLRTCQAKNGMLIHKNEYGAERTAGTHNHGDFNRR